MKRFPFIDLWWLAALTTLLVLDIDSKLALLWAFGLGMWTIIAYGDLYGWYLHRKLEKLR